MQTPILETKRLILRPFKLEDAEAVFEGWESDPEVARYMFWTSHNDIEKTREWLVFEVGQIEKDDWYRFAKENPASGNVMKKLGFQYEKDIPYECNEGKVQLVGELWRLNLYSPIIT